MQEHAWVMLYEFCSKFHTLSINAIFFKSVKIWQSYREFKGGNFFETQCRWDSTVCLRLMWPWRLTSWSQNLISTSMNPSTAVMKIGWNSLYYSFWDVVLTKFSGRTDSLTDRHTRKQYDSGTEGFPWRRHKTYAKARQCFGRYNLYYDILVDNMGIKFTHDAGAVSSMFGHPALHLIRGRMNRDNSWDS